MNQEGQILDSLMKIASLSTAAKLSKEQKLQAIIQQIVKAMRSEKGSIMLLKGRKALEVAASTDPKLIGCRQQLDEDSPSTQVVRSKQSLYSHGKSGRYKKGAFLLTPILLENRVLGVISITEHRGDDTFSLQEQDMMLTFAGQVIGAIEKMKLADDLRKNKRTLEKKNRQLKKLEQTRTELFNMLIHDMKGPISEVIANLDILSYVVAEENKEFVTAAQSGCNTLFHMTADLLDIARLEEGSMPLVRERLKPEELINETLTRIPATLSERKLEINSSVSSKDNLPFTADRGVMTRVLQNLISNAVHYSPIGGTIEVSAICLRKGELRFMVRDQGPGVPPEYQQSIFDKFVQINKRSDGRVYSTGLGLTFCKMAVEAHGGTIYVESDGQHGSCFIVSLPVETV